MNININGYYFASHKQYDENDPTGAGPQADISGKVLVNCKVSYTLFKGLNVFANARNSLNSRTREFYAADQTRAVYLLGMSLNIN